MSFCGKCGAAMKPLFTSEFCPNDCDRPLKWKLEKQLQSERVPAPVQFDDVDTPADGPGWLDIDWSSMGMADDCPSCKSVDTEVFPNCSHGDMHCNTCGHVWTK